MNQKIKKLTFLFNLFKVIGAIMLIFFIIDLVLTKGTISNLSPDAIRFMHFWQINADNYINEGGGFSSAISAIYFSLKSANMYDGGRGRFIQYIFHGIDGLLKNQLPSQMVNYLMVLVVTINSFLISWLSTFNIQRISKRINTIIVIWLILMTTSFVISPILLLNMYGKYLWLTFTLAYFITSKRIFKILFLIAAASADETGLFAVMIIGFLYAARLVLNYNFGISNFQKSTFYHLKRAFLYATLSSLLLLFVFYGISSILFMEGTTFISFSNTVGSSFLNGFLSGEKFLGIFLRSEMILTGTHHGHKLVTILQGLGVITIITLSLLKMSKTAFKVRDETNIKIDKKISLWLNSKQSFFYTFWIIIFIMLTIILPAGGYKDGMGHYIYPAGAVLAILLFTSIHDILNQNWTAVLLLSILSLHLISLPRTIKTTSSGIENGLFLDKTVSIEDLNLINRCVSEFRKNGESPFFKTFNNCQEIDFSGTWYYSRIQKYRDSENYYFPIEGTVRVLLWPQKNNNACSNRVFDFKTTTFNDK